MKKSRYYEIFEEIEKIELEFKILDPKNSFELTRMTTLKLTLNELKNEIDQEIKDYRNSRFRIINGGPELS